MPKPPPGTRARTFNIALDLEDEVRVFAAVDRLSVSAWLNRELRARVDERKRMKPAKDSAA